MNEKTENPDIQEQPRQWVSLTARELDECYFAARTPDLDIWAFAEEIEYRLREKNT